MGVGMSKGNTVEHLSPTLTRGDQLDLEANNSNQYKSSRFSGAESAYNINIDAELQPLESANIGMDNNSIPGLLPITNNPSDEIVARESWRTGFDENDTK